MVRGILFFVGPNAGVGPPVRSCRSIRTRAFARSRSAHRNPANSFRRASESSARASNAAACGLAALVVARNAWASGDVQQCSKTSYPSFRWRGSRTTSLATLRETSSSRTAAEPGPRRPAAGGQHHAVDGDGGPGTSGEHTVCALGAGAARRPGQHPTLTRRRFAFRSAHPFLWNVS
jgi:hypothetical protein